LSRGYFRAWSDEGMEDISLMEPRSEIRVVVDRVELREKNASRLIDSLEKAFTLGEDGIDVHLPKRGSLKFTGRYACPYCSISFGRPTPNLFSFNSPVGACPECRGFGRVIDVDWDLAIPNQALSLYHGAVKVFEAPAARDEKEKLLRFCQKEGISLRTPWRDLPQKAKDRVLFGNGEWPGVKGFFNWLETKRYKAHVRIFLSRFRAYLPCPSCGGTRFKKEALSYRIDGFNIAQVNALSLLESRSYFEKMQSGGLDPATLLLYDEINRRLSYLCEAGLGYLSLDRQSRTLSGGEVARAMLTRRTFLEPHRDPLHPG
jgi:excinuclease ABC subunit A